MREKILIVYAFFCFIIVLMHSGLLIDSHASERPADIIKSIVLAGNDKQGEEKTPGVPAEKEIKNVKPIPSVKDKNARKEEELFEEDKALNTPDNVLLRTGIQLYESGFYTQSLKKFNELEEKHPQSPYVDSARIWIGKIRMRKGEFNEAIKAFNSVRENSGEYPSALYFRGQAKYGKGNKINAIEDFFKLSSQFPEYELADDALLQISKIYRWENRGEQALEAAVKIIRSYPDRETVDDAYFMIGNIYEYDPRLKDIEISRKVYNIFLEKCKDDKFFKFSPLKSRVEKELKYIEATYFKYEN